MEEGKNDNNKKYSKAMIATAVLLSVLTLGVFALISLFLFRSGNDKNSNTVENDENNIVNDSNISQTNSESLIQVIPISGVEKDIQQEQENNNNNLEYICDNKSNIAENTTDSINENVGMIDNFNILEPNAVSIFCGACQHINDDMNIQDVNDENVNMNQKDEEQEDKEENYDQVVFVGKNSKNLNSSNSTKYEKKIIKKGGVEGFTGNNGFTPINVLKMRKKVENQSIPIAKQKIQKVEITKF